MRNLVFIYVFLFFLTQIFSCKKNDPVKPVNTDAHVDLTRNIYGEKGWVFLISTIDSISEEGIPYFSPFPEYYLSNYVFFKLQSIDPLNRVYLRYTEHQLIDVGNDYRIFTDTIRIQKDRGDSIICKIVSRFHDSITPDSPGYFQYTFYGKYNPLSGNVEGFIDTMYYTYRCPTCPGKVYYYYTGKAKAMIKQSPF